MLVHAYCNCWCKTSRFVGGLIERVRRLSTHEELLSDILQRILSRSVLWMPSGMEQLLLCIHLAVSLYKNLFHEYRTVHFQHRNVTLNKTSNSSKWPFILLKTIIRSFLNILFCSIEQNKHVCVSVAYTELSFHTESYSSMHLEIRYKQCIDMSITTF